MTSLEINLAFPDGVEFVSLHSKWDGKWSICIKAGYNVKDAFGSSLGATYASGEAETLEAAFGLSLRRLAEQLEEARQRKPAQPLRLKGMKPGPTPNTDELLAELGL